MSLYLARKITICSNLSITEVINRLSNIIEPKKRIRIPFIENNKPYEGVIGNTYFDIKRVISNNFGFQPPIITGTIESNQSEVRINMTMKPQFFPMLKIVFIVFFLIILNIELLLNNPLSLTLFVPLMILLFLLLIAFFSYSYECNRAEQDILIAIRGRIEK